MRINVIVNLVFNAIERCCDYGVVFLVFLAQTGNHAGENYANSTDNGDKDCFHGIILLNPCLPATCSDRKKR